MYLSAFRCMFEIDIKTEKQYWITDRGMVKQKKNTNIFYIKDFIHLEKKL